MAKDIQVSKDENKMSNNPNSSFDIIPEFESMAERFFGNRFGSLLGDWPAVARGINVGIRETDQAYVLSAEVPEIPMADIDVNGNLLTIFAEDTDESGRDEDQSYQRQYRSFQQSVTLPSTVDPEKIEAHCENGLLEIWVPKTGSAQGRKIDLQSGKGGFLSRLLGKGDKMKKETAGASQDQKH